MRRWRVVFPCGSAGPLLCPVLSSSLSQSVPLQFNWYTRRAVLTGIYNTTELVMMQDTSPDFEDTWRFLENRVADAMNMSSAAQQVTLCARHTQHPSRTSVCADKAGCSISRLLKDPWCTAVLHQSLLMYAAVK